MNLEKQNMIWNMIGSFCYAFASMVLTFLVMRMVGDEQGGIFAFAFSTVGQQMFNVAYFGIRSYQVTDGTNQYSFADYLHHRIITCGAAIMLGVLYLMFHLIMGSYTNQKGAVIFLMILYKVIDGFADVYESEFQRNGNLHLTGKSNTFRTLISVFSFLSVLAFTRHLVFSCVVAVAAQVIGVLLFNIRVIKSLPGVDWNLHKGSGKTLFQNTSLLFASVFLDFYIFSAAKYAIDANMSNSASGYFNIIFMPTSIINLAAGFVIRPFLTYLTDYWNHRRFRDFGAMMRKLLVLIIGLTVLAVGGCALIGKPVLQIIELILGAGYDGKLVVYHYDFTRIVLGGGLYAVASLMYYALVIMRKQTRIFGIYGVVSVAAFLISSRLVRAYGIFGASCAYLAVMILLAIGFSLLALFVYKREESRYEG